MSPLSITSTLALPSGTPIPRLGFGVYLSPPSTCSASVAHALSTGYRHIDTAQYYENESAVGDAVRASALPRSSVFLTTKILFPGADVDATYASIAESVAKLDAGADGSRGYVDLFLIHSPNGGAEKRRIMWTALQRARDEGIVREIGVSNYAVDVLEEIRESGAAWPPAVNQIEVCISHSYISSCLPSFLSFFLSFFPSFPCSTHTRRHVETPTD
jgi:diketogulonate reductase-like aldo/keto reductase